MLEMAARSGDQSYEADQDLLLHCLPIVHIDEFRVGVKTVLEANAAGGAP